MKALNDNRGLSMNLIGIRKEDKNQWERRVPIVPEQVRSLLKEHTIRTMIQRSPNRAIGEDEFSSAGAEFTEDIPDAPVIFAVKEIPMDHLKKDRTYVFFSHVIKGQDYNMPLLKRLMELKCNLIDYERITDSSGRRLVFFGKEAGQAGMIDTLWTLGRRLSEENIPTPLSEIRKTVEYQGLDEAVAHIEEIGSRIRKDGLPGEVCPLIIGFAGYGNVSQGAQEILDHLPIQEIQPSQVERLKRDGDYSGNLLYKVVFKEQHMAELVSGNTEIPDDTTGVAPGGAQERIMEGTAEGIAEETMMGSMKVPAGGPMKETMKGPAGGPIEGTLGGPTGGTIEEPTGGPIEGTLEGPTGGGGGVNGAFDLQDYYDHPENYRGVFSTYVPYLTILMNCIYWDERYPRLVTKAQLREIYSDNVHPTFRVVGDISCDYEGSIEATLHSTESGNPTFIYDPSTDTINEEGQGFGLAIMAVDNLPAELPREASTRFSMSLYPFIPSIAKTDYSLPFNQLSLLPEVKRALILHQGKLTPDYQYLKEYVDDQSNKK